MKLEARKLALTMGYYLLHKLDEDRAISILNFSKASEYVSDNFDIISILHAVESIISNSSK